MQHCTIFRYGKGFGLLEYVVGRKHWINQPNSVFGVAFYILQMILGMYGRSKGQHRAFQLTMLFKKFKWFKQIISSDPQSINLLMRKKLNTSAR